LTDQGSRASLRCSSLTFTDRTQAIEKTDGSVTYRVNHRSKTSPQQQQPEWSRVARSTFNRARGRTAVKRTKFTSTGRHSTDTIEQTRWRLPLCSRCECWFAWTLRHVDPDSSLVFRRRRAAGKEVGLKRLPWMQDMAGWSLRKLPTGVTDDVALLYSPPCGQKLHERLLGHPGGVIRPHWTPSRKPQPDDRLRLADQSS
jgi:hypothetical protein